MQFLVYLTVLMVSVSTILLEVHWLTSPAPPPRPAIQATASPPTPKIEGPNAALSPVYPKKTDAPSPAESASNVQLSTAAAIPQVAPVPRPGAAVPAQQAAPQSTAAATPPQRPAAETTGTVARDDDAKQQAAGATNVSHRAVQEMAAVPPGNRCDIQACAGAYKSFRASDCTYQSFEGPRRVCGKSPVQRAARDQRDEPERRKWSRNAYPPDLDRSTVGRRIDDDEGVADFDDESDQIVIRHLGRRW
ncbi:MAG: BA14K family protein, partial [Pseudolabrys sp.]